MNKKPLNFLAGALLFGFFFIIPSSTQALELTRNLSLGDRGQDVLQLQQFLNTDPQTAISGTAGGSLGQETTYFGNLTKQAVIRFQEKYASEVLAPIGLTAGNGFVGPLTRAKIKELSENTVSTQEQLQRLQQLQEQVEVLQALLEAQEETENEAESSTVDTNLSLDSDVDTATLQNLTDLQDQMSEISQVDFGAFSSVGSLSSGGTPFGGMIQFIISCDHGRSRWIILGPPNGGRFIYKFGQSKSYEYGPPSHPGQWLLGMAGSRTKCRLGPNTDLYGRFIQFHGSSR